MDKDLLCKLYELNGLIISLETLQDLDQEQFHNPMIEKVAITMQEIMDFVKEGQHGSAAERGKAPIRHIG